MRTAVDEQPVTPSQLPSTRSMANQVAAETTPPPVSIDSNETITLGVRSPDGRIAPVDLRTAARLREELMQADVLCRSDELGRELAQALPEGFQPKRLAATFAFSPDEVEPYSRAHAIDGIESHWFPDVDSWFVEVDDGLACRYLSPSSYWPALLRGVVLEERPTAGSRGDRVSRVAIHGLQPCLRPEKQEDEFHRLAFAQAHIDLVDWQEGERIFTCASAIAAICWLIRSLTGFPPADLRIRLSHTKGWTAMLERYVAPAALQTLRKTVLDPIATAAATRQRDLGQLGDHATAEVKRLATSAVPQGALDTIRHRVTTGRYEPSGPGVEAVAAELTSLEQACVATGIATIRDARSARTGYGGPTWQVDCRTQGCWIEVAGGGEYGDALRVWRTARNLAPQPVPAVCGSAVGLDRVLALTSRHRGESRDPGGVPTC